MHFNILLQGSLEIKVGWKILLQFGFLVHSLSCKTIHPC
jgi:hypothetical protein